MWIVAAMQYASRSAVSPPFRLFGDRDQDGTRDLLDPCPDDPGPLDDPLHGDFDRDESCDSVDLCDGDDRDGDADVDGFCFTAGSDCDDSDPNVYPGNTEATLDTCLNGIDDDCDGASDARDADCQEILAGTGLHCNCLAQLGGPQPDPWQLTLLLLVVAPVAAWRRRS